MIVLLIKLKFSLAFGLLPHAALKYIIKYAVFQDGTEAGPCLWVKYGGGMEKSLEKSYNFASAGGYAPRDPKYNITYNYFCGCEHISENLI